MTERTQPSNKWGIPLFPIRVVVAILVIISEILRPVYRRFARWISTLSSVERFSIFVGSLPRGVILILFAVPFAIAEPLKIYALLLIGQRQYVPGAGIIVVAYLLSFVVVEQIYQAGRGKLLTYGWFKWIMDRVKIGQDWVVDMKSALTSNLRRWFTKVV